MANSSDDPKTVDGISRREMLVRAGFVVGAAILPIAPSELAGQTTAAGAPEGV